MLNTKYKVQFKMKKLYVTHRCLNAEYQIWGYSGLQKLKFRTNKLYVIHRYLTVEYRIWRYSGLQQVIISNEEVLCYPQMSKCQMPNMKIFRTTTSWNLKCFCFFLQQMERKGTSLSLFFVLIKLWVEKSRKLTITVKLYNTERERKKLLLWQILSKLFLRHFDVIS